MSERVELGGPLLALGLENSSNLGFGKYDELRPALFLLRAQFRAGVRACIERKLCVAVEPRLLEDFFDAPCFLV